MSFFKEIKDREFYLGCDNKKGDPGKYCLGSPFLVTKTYFLKSFHTDSFKIAS